MSVSVFDHVLGTEAELRKQGELRTCGVAACPTQIHDEFIFGRRMAGPGTALTFYLGRKNFVI